MAEPARPLPELPDAAAFRAWADEQPETWEFADGHLVMMGRASRPHVRLAGNLVAELRRGLHGQRRQPYQSDLAVRVDARNEFLPDVVVDCGAAQEEADEPVLIAEVLSPSTEDYDRGRKWAAYLRLPSLRHYLLLAQDRLLVELFSRRGDAWVLQVIEDHGAEIALDALGVTLRVRALYDGVDLRP